MSFSRLNVILLITISIMINGLSLAHDASEVDRETIEQPVKDAEADAKVFAAEVAKRADAYSEEVLALTGVVMEKMGGVESAPTEAAADGPIDFPKLLAGAPRLSEIREAEAQPAGVMVLVSFSMPEEALRALVVDAHRAGVPVMLRGFAGGSLAETAKRIRALLGGAGEDEAEDIRSLIGGVVIDPRAFRIFGVEEVPVFIATSEPLPDCDGLDCSATPPAHDRITGNISLTAALEALSAEGSEAREEAKAVLKRLETVP